MSSSGVDLAGMFLNAYNGYDKASARVIAIGAEINPSNPAPVNNTEAEYSKALKTAVGELVQTASFSDAPTLPTLSVDYDNYYTTTTVDTTQTPLTVFGEFGETTLDSPTPYIADITKLTQHMVDVEKAITDTIKVLTDLDNAIDIIFTPDIDTFYKAIWTSGFITTLQKYSAENTTFISTKTATRFNDAVATATTLINRYINSRGFNTPILMTTSALESLDITSGATTLDISRDNDLALDLLVSDMYSMGLSAEELVAGFTTLINNASVELEKLRYAGILVESMGSISILRSGIQGITSNLRGLIEVGSIADNYIQVEETKINATNSISDAWGMWTKATLIPKQLTKAINDNHFKEKQNNVALAEATDKLNKAIASGAINITTMQVEKDVAEKDLAVTKNEAEVLKLQAKISKAAGSMNLFKGELANYIEQYTADSQKIKAKVAEMTGQGAISEFTGALISNIVADTSINVIKQ